VAKILSGHTVASGKLYSAKLFFASLAAFVMLAASSQAIALTDSYFVMGEDIDLMMESDKTYTVEEIEYTLRKIPLFRELEEFMFKLQDEYMADEEQ